jgi:hypothetical protein
MSETLVENRSKEWDAFFNKIGYVYYAIAEAANKTDAEGIAELKKNVQKIWRNYSVMFDGFQGYHANKAEAQFDWLNLNETDFLFCMNEFHCYMAEQPPLLTSARYQAILDSASEIAKAMGDSENKALKKLFDFNK